MAYSKRQLAHCKDAQVPDLVGINCRLLFVGINPGLQTAMTGIHFAHPTNRFWPALKKAGLIDSVPDVSPIAPSVRINVYDRPWTAATQTHFCHPSNRFYPALRTAGLIGWTPDNSVGMTDAQRAAFTDKGMAITNLVNRATTRASELSNQELASGGQRLKDLAVELAPRVVAVAGVTAFRTAFGQPKAALGRQEESLAAAELWVVPNPSGLNAHETVDSLADWYSRSATAAGIV